MDMHIMMRILLAVMVGVVLGADEGDWVDPSGLPVVYQAHAFYAGFLNISAQKAYYYVYTPSFSTPSKDPLVVILSQGPGCSSLHSWLYTRGEFTFPRNTSDFATTPNPFSWNQIANVLYIEGPAGVGFSTGNPENQTDESTTNDYFWALLKFYQKFSELKDQPVYLSGQQYAGVIAPRLALKIIEHNRDPETASWELITLGGMFLLNPCTYGTECNHHLDFTSFMIESLKNKFFVSTEDYETYRSSCVLNSDSCKAIRAKIQSGFMITGADIQNVYEPCLKQPGDYPCLDHLGIETVLNLPTLQEDLNVLTPVKWTLCNPVVRDTFQRDGDGSLHIYETLLREEHNLKIWVFSGSMNSLVPTLGTKRWFEEIKLRTGRPATRLWAPWFFKTINAGDYEEIPGLTFITMRAGFFMFDEQPEIAYHVFDTFIKNSTSL